MPSRALDAPVEAPARRRHARLAWGAAVLLVGIGIGLHTRRPREAGEATAAMPALSASDIAERSHLFREVESLFANDLRWMVTSGAKVRLGIAPGPAGDLDSSAPILVRLIVQHRESGDSPWATVRQTDILSRSEEVVEAGARDADDGLLLWAFPLPDGLVSVDAQIRLAAPAPLRADVTAILRPGTPTQVLFLTTEDGEYRIIEAAAPLRVEEVKPCSGI